MSIVVLLDPVITFLFEFKSQLGPGTHHDAAFVEDVHKVGLDIVEQSLVVCDDYRCIIVALELEEKGYDWIKQNND